MIPRSDRTPGASMAKQVAEQPELFSAGPAAPVDVAPAAAALDDLAAGLDARIRLGTSSWSFPGWEGLVWDRTTTETVLARHGLRAYARHPLLRTVGLDRTWYDTLPERAYRDYADQVPDDFRFVVKAERSLMDPGDPHLFDAAWATDRVAGPAATGLGAKLGSLLFQLTPLDPAAFGGPRAFAEALYRFLTDLPRGLPYAVELRTAELLTEDYRQALLHAGGTHGFVAHPRMVPLEAQRRAVPPSPGRPCVVRWMLPPGASYEGARDAFRPFDRLRAPDPERRRAVADTVIEAVAVGAPTFVVINNKAEGSSPVSVVELARLLVDQRSGSTG